MLTRLFKLTILTIVPYSNHAHTRIMNPEPFYILYALMGYLAGSVSTAIITCKLMGLKDPRSIGSQNPGATNVLRHGGKKAAIITLIGDMLKGLLPVLVVQQLLTNADAKIMIGAIAITGTGAFLGHLYPLFFKFKGGKGVATFYGALLGFNWMAGLAALIVWLLTALLFKLSALAALVSTLSAPFIIWYFTDSEILASTTAAMGILLYWRHRSNIQNILNGTEDKIGVKEN
jgi:glycerol-3-phosphate acyltransferase PlsY